MAEDYSDLLGDDDDDSGDDQQDAIIVDLPGLGVWCAVVASLRED